MAIDPNNCNFRIATGVIETKAHSAEQLHQLSRTSLSLHNNNYHQRLGISQTFSNLRSKGKVAFIPYVTAGDPDLTTTARALKLLDSCGADVIELGLPYCDPVADGPVIQASNKRALANMTNLHAVISMLKEVVPQLSCPITVLSYYNLMMKHDLKRFLIALQDGGVQGLLVPDLPFEKSDNLKREAKKRC